MVIIWLSKAHPISSFLDQSGRERQSRHREWSFKQSAPQGSLLTTTAYSFQRSRHNELRPTRTPPRCISFIHPITMSLFFTDSIKAAAFSTQCGSVEFNVSYLVSQLWKRDEWWTQQGIHWFWQVQGKTYKWKWSKEYKELWKSVYITVNNEQWRLPCLCKHARGT